MVRPVDGGFKNLLRFVGYGNPAAPVWFIGLEEGLGGRMTDDEVRKNFEARKSFAKIEDLAAAHLRLFEDGCPIDITKSRKGSSTVWRWMSRFTRACLGEDDPFDGVLATDYIRRELGRLHKKTMMTELSAIPAANLRDRSLVPDLSQFDRDEVCRIKCDRWKEIRGLLDQHQPERVICYGTSAKAQFGELLEVNSWEQVIPKFFRAERSGFYLVPFFGNGQMGEKTFKAILETGHLKIVK